MSAKKCGTINTDGKLFVFQTPPDPSNEFTSPEAHTFDLCSNGVLYDRYISLCQRFFKVTFAKYLQLLMLHLIFS